MFNLPVNLDCVSSIWSCARALLVNSWLVCQEVVIDSEWGRNRTISHDICLDRSYALDSVCLLCKVLVLGPRCGVLWLWAPLAMVSRALRSCALAWAADRGAKRVWATLVVVALFEAIRKARRSRASRRIVIASNQASLNKVVSSICL
jgi:hypothetical protein